MAQPCWRASNTSAVEGSDGKDIHAKEDNVNMIKGKTKASGYAHVQA